MGLATKVGGVQVVQMMGCMSKLLMGMPTDVQVVWYLMHEAVDTEVLVQE